MRNGIDEMLWRMLWIAVAMSLFAYVTGIFFQSVAESEKAEERKIIATNRVGVGVHHITGYVPVPSPCHGVSVKVHAEAFAAYRLVFETWQEPYRDCKREPTYHSFRTVAFGPSVGSTFTAILNGKPHPLSMIQYKAR